MSHYYDFSPDHEIHGQLIIDCEKALGKAHIDPYLKKHGFSNIDPESWYPDQQWLNMLSEIAEDGHGLSDFVAFGVKLAENAAVPERFGELPLLTILQMSDDIYKMNNRGTDVGNIRCEIVADKHVKIIVRVPGPDDYYYGIAYGFVRRFAPLGTHFTVWYDETLPRREQGGDVTVIHVAWE